eukprot:scaffold8770_cov107-Isochrysis_galbana.AAC.3
MSFPRVLDRSATNAVVRRKSPADFSMCMVFLIKFFLILEALAGECDGTLTIPWQTSIASLFPPSLYRSPGLDPSMELEAAILARAEFLDSQVGYDSSGEYEHEPDFTASDLDPESDPDSEPYSEPELYDPVCKCNACKTHLSISEGQSLDSLEIGWSRY